LPARLPESCVHANHLFPIWVDSRRRDDIIGHLHCRGIPSTVNYQAIHLLTYFRETYGFKAGDFPVAERLGSQCISLPFYPGLKEEELERVVQAVAEALGETHAN